jgi:hypothetical protein
MGPMVIQSLRRFAGTKLVRKSISDLICQNGIETGARMEPMYRTPILPSSNPQADGIVRKRLPELRKRNRKLARIPPV